MGAEESGFHRSFKKEGGVPDKSNLAVFFCVLEKIFDPGGKRNPVVVDIKVTESR